MRRLTLSLVALAIVASTAPAGAANREHDQILADIRMLQEQNQRLQLALVTLADALKTVSAKIDESNASLSAASRPSRSREGSGSVKPSACACATASSNVH